MACRNGCQKPPWTETHPSAPFAADLRDCCFHCGFWLDLAQGDQRGAVVAQRVIPYENPPRGPERFSFDPDKPIRTTGGMRGFGGHRWRITFRDGRVVETNDLWHNGEVPERFRDLFPVNAELGDAKDGS